MIDFKKLRYAKKYLMGKEFFSEQFDAALEVLKIMASEKPHTNHIILDALTQTGKTSVMEMIYRILNFENICDSFNIKQVIYMTADNGSGDGSLKCQTSDRFKKHWDGYIHELPIEFLKRSDFDKFEHVMRNTLIMIDESQYGWREITSKGQQILQINGINFCSIEELQKKNMYILSVSATTQNERFGDSQLKLKPIVKLKPGKGYIGVEDFIDNGILKPVVKDEFISSYEALDGFLSKQSKKLKSIYKETGVAKCVILRLLDNKRKGFMTDSDEFNDIAEKNGFKCKLVVHKDSKIDYESLQSYIYYHCHNYGKDEDKFLLVVVKYAFSYGITIKAPIKKLIATCYDIRKDNYSTEATIQGLTGRMTGYGCTLEDFKDLEIFINKMHYDGIVANIEGKNEYACPLKVTEKVARVKCEKSEYDGNKKNIVVWNNDERKPYEFKGEIVDNFFKKYKNKKEIEKIFSNEKLERAKDESLIGKIIYAFFNELNLNVFKKFNKDNVFELRRRIKKSDSQSLRICSTDPIIGSLSRPNWQTEENAINNNIAWGGFIDLTEADPKTLKGVIIRIPYGYVGFAKEGNVINTKKPNPKLYSGYNTSGTAVVTSKAYI